MLVWRGQDIHSSQNCPVDHMPSIMCRGLRRQHGWLLLPHFPQAAPMLCFTKKLLGHRRWAKPGHRAGVFYTSTHGFGLKQLPKKQKDKGSITQGIPGTIRHVTTPST